MSGKQHISLQTPTCPSQNLRAHGIKSRNPWLQPQFSHNPRKLIILSTAETAGTAEAAGNAGTAGTADTADTPGWHC